MMLEIALDADEEWDSSRSWDKLVRKAAEAAIAESDYPELMDSERPVEISVTLTDNEHVRMLNAKWRGKDKPTNVLSLPAAPLLVGRLGPLLGDIVLAAETVRGEAKAQGLAANDHLTHLIVHGFLHLIGYDHEDDSEALVMEGLETTILGDLGIADPYAA